MEYREEFLFRKRTHKIIEDGVLTEQNSFFHSLLINTKFHQLGSIVQYNSELKLSELITCVVFLALGVKGLSKDVNDDILFAISIILIAIAIYWSINILFNLKHIGSYYLSDRIEKGENSFEIKSRYPAKKELQEFLEKLVECKREYDINYIIDNLSLELTDEEIINEIKYLKRKYLLNNIEFENLIDKAKRRKNTDDDML